MPLNYHCMLVKGAGLALLAAAGAAAACSGTPRPRNLLLITLDTMRADRLPPYGFGGVDTPAIDELAAEGTVFEQAFAAVPLTLPSHASLFTGLYPQRLAVRDNADAPLAPEFTTMAEVLRERGLATAAFVASGVLAPGRGLDQGFMVYDEAVSRGCAGAPRARRPANEVVDLAIAWVAEQQGTPFFAWVHLYDAHRPYILPREYTDRYGDPYLEAIAFEDSQISRLVAYLQGSRQLDDTLVVVTGDHGESLGDHGEDTHGIFIYQEALHVPLILRGPGIRPHRVSAVTRLVDVTPTVLELFGAAVRDIDGVSLAGLLGGGGRDPRLDVYAESLYPQRFGWSSLRSLRAGRYKVIEAPRPELYDLAADPYEQHDIFDQRRTVGSAMLERLRAVDASGSRTPNRGPVLDRSAAARISSLGYVGGGSEAVGASVSGGVDPKDQIATFNRITSVQQQMGRRVHAGRSGCTAGRRP
jgi:arylsulfatase A-like enzyme